MSSSRPEGELPAPPATIAPPRPEPPRVSAAPFVYTQDFTLAQRAAEGEARAEKQLAQRLIVRVRRAAHALMAGASEADDGAQQALVELLRSARDYPGTTSLESWADRLAARSLVRFARAVRTRKASAPDVSEQDGRPERFARTLEEFLRELPRVPRESLLLREALGFDLVEIARLMRSSTRAVREQLSRARHGLYVRALKDDEQWDAPLPESVERWFALRDRSEAASYTSGGADELSVVEQEELKGLEAQPELRKLQKELRALAQFLEGGRFGLLSARDKRLLEGALAAARVSAISGNSALPREAARELESEAVDTSWVHPISLGMCVLLVVGAFVALALRTPQSKAPQSLPHSPRAETAHAPIVEALSSAHAVERGARLLRSGAPLEQGASLREGDVVSAEARAGCFGSSPRADVCLAANSMARVAQLGLNTRRVEVLRGRAVASVERVEPGVPLALSVGSLYAETVDGVLGFELDGETIVVRVLRGSAALTTPQEKRTLSGAQSAIYRPREGKLEVVAQLAEKARRDWDLLATRAAGQPTDRPATAKPEPLSPPAEAADPAPALPAAAPQEEVALVDAQPSALGDKNVEAAPVEALPAEAEPPSDEAPPSSGTPVSDDPEQQLVRAKALSREREFARAAEAFGELIRDTPSSRSAREALVLRGELLSERLYRPAEALPLFERYLGSGGGLLEVRARYGRILALRHLNRSAEEQAATQEFLLRYGDTPQARVLRARSSEAR